MHLRKNWVWPFFLSCWLALAALAVPAPAAACQPSLPNAYTEEITIEQGDLPADIVLERIFAEEWKIRNNSEHTIYLVHPQTAEALQSSESDATPTLDRLATILPSTSLTISWVYELSDYVPQLTDWNSAYVPNPAGTPADQEGSLAVEMDGLVYHAPVRVQFTIVPEYQEALERGSAACAWRNLMSMAPAGLYLCIPLLFLTVIGVLVTLFFRRPRRVVASND
jgi:hypothetical protein